MRTTARLTATYNTYDPLATSRSRTDSFVGLSLYHTVGVTSWTLALDVALAIAAMMLTKTTHPPAGANPIIVMLSAYNWDYLISRVLLGTLVIVGVALIVNNLRNNRHYPIFWK